MDECLGDSGGSQWNPRRSRGARQPPGGWGTKWASLSGTPAEAGVRAAMGVGVCPSFHVSVEPPPKQGCERYVMHPVIILRRLSGTPAEAGVRDKDGRMPWGFRWVSVEPPPKQGCETAAWRMGYKVGQSQWNPRRSRGASCNGGGSMPIFSRLSGTPAEAGVRAVRNAPGNHLAASQWNPRRSRGARADAVSPSKSAPSQWNPRRSRGASKLDWYLRHKFPGLSGTPAEAGVRDHNSGRASNISIVSVEPPPKQGCEKSA